MHWRMRSRRRRLFREVNSGRGSIMGQLFLLFLFAFVSCLLVLYSGTLWLGWVILVVWVVALERIVRQTR